MHVSFHPARVKVAVVEWADGRESGPKAIDSVHT